MGQIFLTWALVTVVSFGLSVYVFGPLHAIKLLLFSLGLLAFISVIETLSEEFWDFFAIALFILVGLSTL